MDNKNNSVIEYIRGTIPRFIKAFRHEICKHITDSDVIKKAESIEIAVAFWTCEEELFRGVEVDKTITPFGLFENVDDIIDFTCEDDDYEKAFSELLKEKGRFKCASSRIVEGVDFSGELGKSSEIINKFNVMWVAFLKNEPKGSEKYIGIVVADLFGEYLESKKDLKCLSDFESIEDKFNRCFLGDNFDFMARYMRVLENKLGIPAIDMLTRIAHTKYENLENDAKMYFVKDVDWIEKKEKFVQIKEGSYLEKCFQNKNSISGIRKLLEICKGSSRCLIVKCNIPEKDGTEMEERYEVVGILQSDYDVNGESELALIHFKAGAWSLYCHEELLLKYKNGKYYVGDQSVNVNLEKKCEELKLNPKFARLFSKVRDSVNHGALIIVAEDAEAEVQILCNKFKRGTQIVKMQIDEDNQELLIAIASIDGAVFMDNDLNCYGFGVVLDGLARVRGEVGRGSRYNSSLNYIHNSNKKRWAIVFSEDKEKGIDIISNENKQIRMTRENIDDKI